MSKLNIRAVLKPFLPAVVTGAVVFSCATAPVLQPIPERLPEPVREAQAAEPELLDSERPARTENAGDAAALASVAFSTPEGGYADGVYTGSARGFGGAITVQVTIAGGEITDITVLSAPGETASYYARATAVIPAMLAQQSPNVDTVSGATYSSNGIINAVKSALSQAGAATAPDTPTVPEPLATTPAERPNYGYPDGVYTGTGEGFGGDVTVRVTVSGGQITALEVLEAAGETEPFFTNAKNVLNAILAAQTANVDAVSGATFSSEGLKEAVRNALTPAPQLALTSQPEKMPEPETAPNEPILLTGAERSVDVATEVYTGAATVFPDEYEDFDAYPITVTVTVTVTTTTVTRGETQIVTTERVVTDVSVASDTGRTNQTYLNRAMNQLKTALLAGDAEVDAVSGATCSSEGIRSAYRAALAQTTLGKTELVSALPPEPAAGDEEGAPDDAR